VAKSAKGGIETVEKDLEIKPNKKVVKEPEFLDPAEIKRLAEENTDLLLPHAKTELDAAVTKQDMIAVWKRYYGTLGHRKLGRLLVGNGGKN
jgi:hypothetical protein